MLNVYRIFALLIVCNGGMKNNHLQQTPSNPNEECEIYACVNKLLGNGMAHVVDTKGTTLMLHIRNKFRAQCDR